jgi:peptidase YpeB-like protein
MKLFAPLLLSASALVLTVPTLAGVPGSDWMPADQVIAKLVSEGGYSVVSEIEAEHGRWEGEGMKKRNQDGIPRRREDGPDHFRKTG